ncbi:hypothetical protein OSTOST_04635 [Ostertagia ostertagi]
MVALLLIGTLNSNLFCGSRFMHAAAREGHLPTCMSCRHEASNSPRAALLGQAICTFAMSFVDIDTLINYVTFVMWSQKVVTVAALLYIRYNKIPVSESNIYWCSGGCQRFGSVLRVGETKGGSENTSST